MEFEENSFDFKYFLSKFKTKTLTNFKMLDFLNFS